PSPIRAANSRNGALSAMSTTVRIPTALRTLTGGASEVSPAASPVGALLKSLDAAHPGMAERPFDDAAAPRPFRNALLPDGGAAAAAGGQGALVTDLRLRVVLRLAGDVDGEGEVLAGQLAATLTVVVLLVRILVGRGRHVGGRRSARQGRGRRVGGHQVDVVGAGVVGGGQVGRVRVVPRCQLVEEGGAVVAGRGG